MLRVDQLSARQRQILDSVAAGKSNGVIADEIGVTLDGVKWHVPELLGETGFASRHELADWWRQRETSPRAAPVWLPRRALSHPLAASLARVVAVFAIAAAIATGISVVAQRGADVTLAPTPAAQDKIAYVQGGDLWVKTLPDGQPRRITTDGQVGMPRWSSSGGWLAYDDASATWIARTDGSAARRVDGFSGWSPVADRYAGVDPSGAIFVENADGTGYRTLVPTPLAQAGMVSQVQGMAWSPDGMYLAYGVLDYATVGAPPVRHAMIWRVRVDGGTREMIYDAGTPTRDGIAPAGWTADGNNIVVGIDPFFSASIQADGLPYELLPGAGGSLRPLIARTIFGPYPAPAGNLLLFTGGATRYTWTQQRIAVADPATGKITDLTDPAIAAIAPAWSPDGARIAYVAAPDASASVVGGDLAKAAMAKRKIWVMDADGGNKRQLTSDPAYRDERPRWTTDGTRVLFARLDANDRASLWLVPVAGGAPTRVVDSLTPPVAPGGAPVWFGYYGYVAWDSAFALWSPPRPARAAAAGTTSLSLATLGLTSSYPAAWVEGAATEWWPAATSCSMCTVLGPASASHPYGVEIFTEDLDPGCDVSCYVGNNAIGVAGGPLGPAVQSMVRVAGIDAKRMEIGRHVPLGILAQTGDDTPYRETWTLVPWYGKALFFVAFYREGDRAAETETRAAYDALLASVSRVPPPPARGAYSPHSVSAGETVSVWGYGDALDTRPCLDAVPDMMPAAYDVPGGTIITCVVDAAAAARLRFVSSGGNVLRLDSVQILMPAMAASPSSGGASPCNDLRSILLSATADPHAAPVRLACWVQPPARGSVNAARGEFWAYVLPGTGPTAASSPVDCWELARFLGGAPEAIPVVVPCWLE